MELLVEVSVSCPKIVFSKMYKLMSRIKTYKIVYNQHICFLIHGFNFQMQFLFFNDLIGIAKTRTVHFALEIHTNYLEILFLAF